MNSWQIKWDLNISREDTMKLLHKIIQSPGEKQSGIKKYNGNITGDCFDLTIKRSLALGTAFRDEVKGRGLVSDQNDGSCISAQFDICSPYKYVNLDGKKLSIIILSLILSWVGLILTSVFPERFGSLDYLLIPIFVFSCFTLLIGFFKYYLIIDKFKELKKSFKNTFHKYIKEKS